MKNLKKITIYIYHSEVAIEVIDALILSKCESVTEIDVSGIPANELKRFLHRQKNLCKLTAMDIIIKNEFLIYLPVSLQEINCHFKKVIPDSLCILKNLTTIFCRIDNLTDKSINALTKACNLKDIKNNIGNYSFG